MTCLLKRWKETLPCVSLHPERRGATGRETVPSLGRRTSVLATWLIRS